MYLVNYINDNLEVLSEEYYNEFGEIWELNYFVDYYELFNEHDELIAYLISFDNGYLTVGLDLNLYDLSTTGDVPFLVLDQKNYLIGHHYYIKNDDLFIPNSINAPDLYLLDGTAILFEDEIFIELEPEETDELSNFRISFSIADDLQTSSGSSGDYTIYTRDQTDLDCGAQAAINIVYSFELSGVTGLAQSMNSDNELATMRSQMNWTPAGRTYLGQQFDGIWPHEIRSGLTSYLPSNYRAVSSGYFGPGYNGPAIGLYFSASIIDTAHYAMIIGSAQADAWWIFKTNYDIISHWNENHYYSPSGEIDSKMSDIDSYYFVKSLYRQNTFNIQRRVGPSWSPIWTRLEK